MPDTAFTPALMKEGAAAFYVGVSVSTLRTLNIPRRVLRKLRLYDRRDLDDFRDGLPYEGEGNGRANTCDEAFA